MPKGGRHARGRGPGRTVATCRDRFARRLLEGSTTSLAAECGAAAVPTTTDRQRFLKLLEITRAGTAGSRHLRADDEPLPPAALDAGAEHLRGVQYLNGRYCAWFNWRHGYEGHVVERRFYSVLIESERHLFAAAQYIVLNPVRAGLCRFPRLEVEQLPGDRRRSPPSRGLSRWLIDLFGRDLKQHAELRRLRQR